MKTSLISIILGCAAMFALTSGCNKQSEQSTSAPAADVKRTAETPPPAPAPPAPAPAPATVDNAAATAQAPAAAPQDTAQKAAADASNQADQTVSKNQSILDSAQQLLADNKPADALKKLNDLVAAKLTPAQQATLDNLKKQAESLIEKLTSSKASDAVGGLLKKQ
jgi:hypothetical protein